jgi:hypothetical protein
MTLPSVLPFEYETLTAMTVTAARAALLELEPPVVPLTSYRDCGDGTFVVMSDVLTRFLRPLSHDRDYLVLAQFGGILLKAPPIREFLRTVPKGVQLRCRFTDHKYTLLGQQVWTSTSRQWDSRFWGFGLMVEYTLEGIKSRTFFACVDMRFYKVDKKDTLFRFEMYQDIPGNPRWMAAYNAVGEVEVRPVVVSNKPAEPTFILTHLERQIVDYLDAHPKSEALAVLDGIKGNHEIDKFYASLYRLVNVGALVSDTVLTDRVYEISNHYRNQLTSQYGE